MADSPNGTDGTAPLDVAAAEFEAVLRAAREQFETSRDFTIGIEEEWALLDPRTLDLVPEFERVRAAAVEAGLESEVAGELLASEIEFLIRPCESWSEARGELLRLRGEVARLLDGAQLRGAISGTHPWADYREQRTIDAPYYRMLVERLQYVARRNNTFGLHVHVGVRGADRAVRIATALRDVQPHLLALSASSPFLDGVDSGLASARSMTFSRTFPRGNIAPPFESLDEYLAYLRLLFAADSIFTPNQVWWGARPHIKHGTVELRMFDGQPDVHDTLALAALALGTVADLCDCFDSGRLDPPQHAHMVDENLWRAVRYGTEAEFIDIPTGRTQPASDAIGALIARAREAGERHRLGIEEGLDRAGQILEHGCSALRQRAQAQSAGGDLREAYRHVVDLTMGGIGLGSRR